VVAQTEDKYTLPVALALYSVAQNATEYGMLLPGAVVILVPILLMFPFAASVFRARHRDVSIQGSG
jgi:multiple sugar transport system permease protein